MPTLAASATQLRIAWIGSGLDLAPFGPSGLGVGGAGAVIGFLNQSMRFGHERFLRILMRRLPVFWSPDDSPKAMLAEASGGVARCRSRLLEFHVQSLAKFV
jgi:hypothetical protein